MPSAPPFYSVEPSRQREEAKAANRRYASPFASSTLSISSWAEWTPSLR